MTMEFSDILAGERVRRFEITDECPIKCFVRRWIDQTSQRQSVWFRIKVIAGDEFPQDAERPWAAKANDANPTAAGRRS